jgi:hypothetical protein
MTNFSTSLKSECINESNIHSSKEISLKNFEIIKVIGRGSFGKVYFV